MFTLITTIQYFTKGTRQYNNTQKRDIRSKNENKNSDNLLVMLKY